MRSQSARLRQKLLRALQPVAGHCLLPLLVWCVVASFQHTALQRLSFFSGVAPDMITQVRPLTLLCFAPVVSCQARNSISPVVLYPRAKPLSQAKGAASHGLMEPFETAPCIHSVPPIIPPPGSRARSNNRPCRPRAGCPHPETAPAPSPACSRAPSAIPRSRGCTLSSSR